MPRAVRSVRKLEMQGRMRGMMLSMTILEFAPLMSKHQTAGCIQITLASYELPLGRNRGVYNMTTDTAGRYVTGFLSQTEFDFL